MGAELPVSHASLQEIVCCMGMPVAGNPTQYMMEKAFEAAQLDWRYLTLEVAPDDLAAAVAGMRAMGFRGANFTIPHKVAVLEHLDELSEAAALIGAVNCVHRRQGRLWGENTDGKGFVQSLSGVIDPAHKRVVVLGAGGAARAIAVELGRAGAAHVTIVNRTQKRGEELCGALDERASVSASFAAWDGEYRAADDTDVIINATSIGLGDPQALVPIDYAALRPGMVVADVVFNPPSTLFLRRAKQAGCTLLDGLGMLVNQAAIAFEIWSGAKPNRDVMREALEEFLEL